MNEDFTETEKTTRRQMDKDRDRDPGQQTEVDGRIVFDGMTDTTQYLDD